MLITAINPAAAIVGAGVRVTVVGGGFDDDTTFRIGPSALGAVDVENAGAAFGDFAGDLPVGVYDVIVQRGDLVFTFPSGFAVNADDSDDSGDDDDDVVDGGGCACSGGGVDVGACALALLLLRRRYSLFARG